MSHLMWAALHAAVVFALIAGYVDDGNIWHFWYDGKRLVLGDFWATLLGMNSAIRATHHVYEFFGAGA